MVRNWRSARWARTFAAPTEHSRIVAISENGSSLRRLMSRTSRSSWSRRESATWRRAWSSLARATSLELGALSVCDSRTVGSVASAAEEAFRKWSAVHLRARWYIHALRLPSSR